MDFIRLGKREAVVQEETGALESVRAVSLDRGKWLETEEAVAVCFAVAACLVHFLWNGRYGYFRDELYYAACGQHLAWGYVDQAPLIAVIARLSRMLFGDSLHALRFFPALSSGAKILLTGWIVRELGGRRYAQILAATAMLLCPIYLTMDNFLSMNAFEPVFWMLCVAISLRIIRTGNDRLWLLFGLVAGIGILNKHSMLIFGLAFVLALGRVASTRDAPDAVDLARRIHRISDFSPEFPLGGRESLADDRDSSECRSHEEYARVVGAIHSSASLPRASPGRADLHRRVVVFPAQPRGPGVPLSGMDVFVSSLPSS